jgi:hypothetical protein
VLAGIRASGSPRMTAFKSGHMDMDAAVFISLEDGLESLNEFPLSHGAFHYSALQERGDGLASTLGPGGSTTIRAEPSLLDPMVYCRRGGADMALATEPRFPAADPRLVFELARDRLTCQLGQLDALDSKIVGFLGLGSGLLGVLAAFVALREDAPIEGALTLIALAGVVYGALVVASLRAYWPRSWEIGPSLDQDGATPPEAAIMYCGLRFQKQYGNNEPEYNVVSCWLCSCSQYPGRRIGGRHYLWHLSVARTLAHPRRAWDFPWVSLLVVSLLGLGEPLRTGGRRLRRLRYTVIRRASATLQDVRSGRRGFGRLRLRLILSISHCASSHRQSRRTHTFSCSVRTTCVPSGRVTTS